MTGYAIARAVSKDAGVDRVVVDGVDITDFRSDKPSDKPIEVPGYELVAPFGYGTSEPLIILRTNSLLGDVYGEGDLHWLRQGALVQYGRVYNQGTIDEEFIVDYRGIMLAPRAGGPNNNFVVGVAGEVVGRSGLLHKQPVLIRKEYDLGSMVHFAAVALGLTLVPRIPSTGLVFPNQGGNMTFTSWLASLGAMSQTNDVAQRALMPLAGEWGGSRWSFAEKDTTTVHFTTYADGETIGADLVDDVSEKPNTIFANGVSPNGERWRGARYPGFFQGTPAPYPFNDDRDFGFGTTDADTDTGDGITLMRGKLAWANLIPDQYSIGDTFDLNVVRAVNRLKKNAGLAQDGVMTPAAWLALWDKDAVGYSPEGAKIFPIAQDPTVRSQNFSSTGNVMGPNEDFDDDKLRVDATYDAGICDEAMFAAWAEGKIQSVAGHQWAGTIMLNDSAVFSGEHGDAYAVAVNADPPAYVDDVMPARDIRPGMNTWMPYFDGGTKLHVSGVKVSGRNDKGQRTVSLTVDTGARDYFELVAALKRNQESARSPYREWKISNLGQRPSNNFVSRDKFFGKLYIDTPLRGGHWNVVPILMGASGTVSKNDIRLTDAATEFCYAVWCKEIFGDSMDGFVGDPFSLDDDGLTVWEHENMQKFFTDQMLRGVWGQGAQPCGFSWMKGYDPEGNRTANPLVGTHLSLSTWTYATIPGGPPWMYLTIFPLDDCILQRGALFAALEDDVT